MPSAAHRRYRLPRAPAFRAGQDVATSCRDTVTRGAAARQRYSSLPNTWRGGTCSPPCRAPQQVRSRSM
jgi:hypothetical protein